MVEECFLLNSGQGRGVGKEGGEKRESVLSRVSIFFSIGT